jgi:c-di-GMP-binding flagellar brake protein YcgR
MLNEKRQVPRVNTHIIAEMKTGDESERLCAYIENISEKGMGVISLDNFEKGTRLFSNFNIPGTTQKINPRVSVLNSKNTKYNLYYHSLCFDSISTADREAIHQYIQEIEPAKASL